MMILKPGRYPFGLRVLGLWAQDLGFECLGLGFGFQDFVFKAWCLGMEVWVGVLGLGFHDYRVRLEACGSGWGFTFRLP